MIWNLIFSCFLYTLLLESLSQSNKIQNIRFLPDLQELHHFWTPRTPPSAPKKEIILKKIYNTVRTNSKKNGDGGMGRKEAEAYNCEIVCPWSVGTSITISFNKFLQLFMLLNCAMQKMLPFQLLLPTKWQPITLEHITKIFSSHHFSLQLYMLRVHFATNSPNLNFGSIINYIL